MARPTNVVLFEIDEKAVADAVSWDPQSKPQAAPMMAPPPPPPPAPAEPKVATITTTPAAPTELSPPSLPDIGGDLPLPAIGVGLLAGFAVVTFAMRGNVDEEKAASTSPAPAAAASGGVDLSIPYDAAAKLAYEKSNKSMDYPAFKKQYEADAVADVKAKQKK